jgi:hypothetical protein
VHRPAPQRKSLNGSLLCERMTERFITQVP